MRSDRYADETVIMDREGFITDSEEELDEYEDDGSEDKKRSRFGHRRKAKHDDEDGTDLSRLKKKELLEIMLAQGKEIDTLRNRVAELESQLANREFEFSKIGSIAEASLAVTNIFKEAEEAARIYLDNIRRSYERKSNEHSAE